MNSYNYSYNVLINRLEAFAAGHFLIKRFTHGQIDLADQLQDDQYPFMHVTPDTITPVQGGMQFGFHIIEVLSERDITKFAAVTECNVLEVFTHLTYLADYAYVQKVEMRKRYNE